MNPNFEIQDNVLVKYTGSEAEVFIPNGIVAIGDKAFNGNTTLVSVIMPDSLVKIGANAFEKCTKLKTVEFSKNLEEIGYCAFSRCKGLKELTLSDTLRTVGGGAFSGCDKLQKIHCDSKVYEPGSNPFSTYDTKVPPALIDKDGFLIFLNVLFQYTGNAKEVIVPDGVTHIAGGVFRSGIYNWETRLDMESVVLPDTLRHIGNNAFSNCVKLCSIRMPADVAIGVDAFLGCSGLADENGFVIQNGTLLAYCGNTDAVVIPSGVKAIAPNVFQCGYGTNPGNKNIHTVSLPEGLESIGTKAFANCDLLERIVIPETVTAIGETAFAGCDHLSSVTLPEHIESMGNGVFMGCSKLADENGFLIFHGVLQGFYSSDREITIPEGVTAITSRCFEKSGIRTVKLPSTLKNLGSSFRNCDLLEEIAIPEGVTEIPPYCFQECVHLQKVQLPTTLKKIGSSAFVSCAALTEIHLPAGLETLDVGAFENCAALVSVDIPEGVEYLPFSCFNKCGSLTQVRLPASLKSIGNRCFSNCASLTAVTLPAGLNKIGNQAFSGCVKLETVDCPNSLIEIDKFAFEDCDALADKKGFVIVGGILLQYVGNGGNVTVPEGVTELSDNVFREGSTFSYRVYRTFRKEGSLKGLTLPATLKRIGFGAIAGCTALQTLEIPEGVETIEAEAFRGSNLQSIRLPESLTSLSKETFLECAKLTHIRIPAGVRQIGVDAFRGCSSLTEIQVAENNPCFASVDGMLTDKAGTALLWCPAGKKYTAYEIPGNFETIGSHAFIDQETLKKIVIPATVKNIGDEVFPARKWNATSGLKIIEADIQAGSGTLGENIFNIGNYNEQPLEFPKLPLHLVKEQAVQTLLVLGYCMAPDKYEGEYEELYKKYAASHEKSLLKKADSLKLPKVREYFASGAGKATAKKTVNYKKLSPQGKVEMLEEAVLSGDVAKAKTVIEGCGEFEFTARVLGLACLYSSPEMVKLLVENGASFQYVYQSAFKRKYGAAFTTTYNQYPASYSHLIAQTEVSVYNPMLYADCMNYHFGDLPKVEKPRNNDETRVEIAKYLLTVPQAHFNAAAALTYALLWGCAPLAQCLLDAGTPLSADAVNALTDTAASVERNEFVITLAALTPENCLFALKNFRALLAAMDKKIVLPQKAFEEQKTVMLNADVLRLIFAETDTSKLTKSKLVEMVIDKDDVQALSVLVEAGAFKTTVQREKAITYAMNQKKTEALAWLMDYKNKTADVAAEAAKAEAKAMRELTEDPNSVTAMKRVWSYKKQEDGTLEITSYKGSDEVVTVPEKIGKATVTAIGEEAFSGSEFCRAKNWEARRKIRHIILPDTIRKVGVRAFFLCESLEKLDAPKTLTNYGTNAFSRCPKLFDLKGFLILHNVLVAYTVPTGTTTKVVIPEGVTAIAAHVFHPHWSTDSINKVTEFVLPETLETIGESAFEKLPKLLSIRLPDSVKEIGKSAFSSSGLQKIEWGSGLCRIGEMAFANTQFTQLRLPRNITALEDHALYGCSKLRDLYISDTLTEIGKEVLGNYGEAGEYRWSEYRPAGLYVYTPEGSAADTYMQQYPGVHVSHEYSEE